MSPRVVLNFDFHQPSSASIFRLCQSGDMSHSFDDSDIWTISRSWRRWRASVCEVGQLLIILLTDAPMIEAESFNTDISQSRPRFL